ncbi:MAG: hypothetical protein C4545_08305 [Anaerolineaceae bacterium]|nr:MAG: hypothetical protein C4545_08305 [Anaerolineaceae bacterium]
METYIPKGKQKNFSKIYCVSYNSDVFRKNCRPELVQIYLVIYKEPSCNTVIEECENDESLF